MFRPSIAPIIGVYKTVIAASGTGHTIWGTSLQFYVLLMMGAMDGRNMWSNLAVNKYLHTVASRWILST